MKGRRALNKKGSFSEPFAVGTGLEPATPCVTGTYSNQLNYPTKYSLSKQAANIYKFGKSTRQIERDVGFIFRVQLMK